MKGREAGFETGYEDCMNLKFFSLQRLNYILFWTAQISLYRGIGWNPAINATPPTFPMKHKFKLMLINFILLYSEKNIEIYSLGPIGPGEGLVLIIKRMFW